jgi:hypothetical protein
MESKLRCKSPFSIWTAAGLGMALLALVNCSNSSDSGPDKYLVPVITSQGEQLQEVELPTLHKPQNLSGDVAEIVLKNASFGDPSKGVQGKTEMRLSKQGNLWVANDPVTQLGLGSYYLMEQIYAREKAMGVLKYLNYPLRMAVAAEVNQSSDRLEFQNNASVFTDYMSVVVYRYGDSYDPMALDPTVMSHEHFHLLFEVLFMRPFMNRMIQRFNVTEDSLATAYRNNQNLDAVTYVYGLIQAWNEGLADFYSYVHTGETHFGRWSLSPTFSEAREMSVPNLEHLFLGDQALQVFANPGPDCERMCVRYVQGTTFARTMYKLSIAESTREQLAVELLAHLPDLANQLADDVIREVSSGSKLDIGMDYLLTHLYGQRPGWTFNSYVCNTLRAALTQNFDGPFRDKCRDAI